MKKKHYTPIGDKKQGFKLTIPAGVEMYDNYEITVNDDGSLLYVPVKA